MKIICKRVRLDYIQIFPPGRQLNTMIWVWGQGWGRGVLYEVLGGSVLCDPRTLSLYHSMFSCNFATLAILDIYVCNMCAMTKANEKSLHCVRQPLFCMARTWLVLTVLIIHQ